MIWGASQRKWAKAKQDLQINAINQAARQVLRQTVPSPRTGTPEGKGRDVNRHGVSGTKPMQEVGTTVENAVDTCLWPECVQGPREASGDLESVIQPHGHSLGLHSRAEGSEPPFHHFSTCVLE